MPTSPSSSIGSREPFETVSAPEARPQRRALNWRRPALLFVLTVASILYRSAVNESESGARFRWVNGIPFTVSLLAILLTHEFAHFLYARYHNVDTSLPHFIPLPVLAPFGTMGAVILMRDRIKSRNAL